jgi:anaerobic magnesium-protoporphyrin IX monomethyl ester cyclase
MRIVFINPALRPGYVRIHLPVGLGHIMTETAKAGYEFDLIDMDLHQMSMDTLESMLGKKLYDVYAFGCMITGYKFARQIAEVIKSINPEAIVVAGNTVSTAIPEILLQNTKVDIAVLGEGDITFVELLRALELKKDLADVAGIAFKREEKIIFAPPRPLIMDLDCIGFPNWDLFELEKYPKQVFLIDEPDSAATVAFPLNHARGCPFDCTFCSSSFTGLKYRRNSEHATLAEIRRLHDRYGCNYVLFWDELTFPNVRSVEGMIDQITSLNFSIRWNPTIRGNLFKAKDLSLLKDLKASGCDYINYSLESASPEILAAMRKKMAVEEFVEQCKTLWKAGITSITSVIFGYPQETPETIQRTLDICEECNLYPSAGFLLPLVGTPIYAWAKQRGYITDEVAYLESIGDRQDFHINLTAMSDAEFADTVTTKLLALAEKQGLTLQSPLKTGTYQVPRQRAELATC